MQQLGISSTSSKLKNLSTCSSDKPPSSCGSSALTRSFRPELRIPPETPSAALCPEVDGLAATRSCLCLEHACSFFSTFLVLQLCFSRMVTHHNPQLVLVCLIMHTNRRSCVGGDCQKALVLSPTLVWCDVDVPERSRQLVGRFHAPGVWISVQDCLALMHSWVHVPYHHLSLRCVMLPACYPSTCQMTGILLQRRCAASCDHAS
jgi:hypothetical protein